MRLHVLLLLAVCTVLASAAPYWSITDSYEPTCKNFENVYSAYKEVVGVDAVKHRVRNNYKISSTYHRLGTLFSKLVGMWDIPEARITHGNWPGMATWASNTVGFAIRGHMISFDTNAIMDAIDRAYPWLIPKATRAQLERLISFVENFILKSLMTKTSEVLGQGNRDVFHDIGEAFNIYASAFCDQPPLAEAAQRFVKVARDIDPDGTRPAMVKAFVAIFQVHYKTDIDPVDGLTGSDIAALAAAGMPLPKVDLANARTLTLKQRVERMFFANMLVGLVEQTNLQSAIEASIPEPTTLPWGDSTITINWSFVFTKCLMTLQWGEDTLFVGQHLPHRAIDGEPFGPHLSVLEDSLIMDTYARMGGHARDVNGTAADDWVSLDHRMRFIAPLFRSRQDLESLTCHPFSEKQHAAIWGSTILPAEANLCLSNCCKQNGRPH